jgi:hypothetical protein
MGTEGRAENELADELAKVAEVIRREDVRDSLAADARGTLQSEGVDVDKLPSNVVDVLSGMSPQELDLVARMNDALVEAGLVVEGPDEGRVGFF